MPEMRAGRGVGKPSVASTCHVIMRPCGFQQPPSRLRKRLGETRLDIDGGTSRGTLPAVASKEPKDMERETALFTASEGRMSKTTNENILSRIGAQTGWLSHPRVPTHTR